MLLTFDIIKNNKEVNTYLKYADEIFAAIGYKEHGLRHAEKTANTAAYILKQLGYDSRMQELAKVAGYMHDIGNIVAKRDHAQSGAIIAIKIFKQLHLKEEKYNSDLLEIFGAIGSHEDKSMEPPTFIAAAVVLGDKTDVHHDRLRSEEQRYKDTHSKVIAACEKSEIEIPKNKKKIILKLDIDTNICSIMEYFEIFTSRMIFCRKACSVLKCDFGLYINGDEFL